MDFKTYQIESRKTAIYPNCDGLYYVTLGLCGESGEIAEKVKKLIRDKNGVIDNEFRNDLTKEIGDLCWYMSQLCTELNIDFDDVATQNLEKLQDRQKRRKLHGSGDNR